MESPQVAFEVRTDPALAEAVVHRVLTRAEAVGLPPGWIVEHRRRLDRLYGVADASARDAAFGRLARAEFETLGLASPILEALSERPSLAGTVALILLAEAGGRFDEGVTCEPGGAHLGFRVEIGRFESRGALLSWARHTLGHAEDTLDPAFDFEPGWEETVRARGRAVVGRLHHLWDVTVDARLAAAGRLEAEPAVRRHRAVLGADVPEVAGQLAERVVDYLWNGPRPPFPRLRSWAERPTDLLREAAPGVAAQPRPDRCPLCGFPSDDVGAADADVARTVSVDYPGWLPADGICGRCTDRYRFARALGART